MAELLPSISPGAFDFDLYELHLDRSHDPLCLRCTQRFDRKARLTLDPNGVSGYASACFWRMAFRGWECCMTCGVRGERDALPTMPPSLPTPPDSASRRPCARQSLPFRQLLPVRGSEICILQPLALHGKGKTTHFDDGVEMPAIDAASQLVQTGGEVLRGNVTADTNDQALEEGPDRYKAVDGNKVAVGIMPDIFARAVIDGLVLAVEVLQTLVRARLVRLDGRLRGGAFEDKLLEVLEGPATGIRNDGN